MEFLLFIFYCWSVLTFFWLVYLIAVGLERVFAFIALLFRRK